MTHSSTTAATDAGRLRTLRDCYQEDHRSHAILDVYASRVERRHVLNVDDWAVLAAGKVAAKASVLGQIARSASLYMAEKVVLLGQLMVLGSPVDGEASRDESPSSICAPLWFTPVDVVVDGPARLVPAFERTYPNHPLLSMLAARFEVDAEALERLERSLPRPGESSFVQRTLSLLETTFPEVRFSRSEPATVDSATDLRVALRRIASRKPSSRPRLALSPSSHILLFVKQAVDTRGVLYELNRLAANGDQHAGGVEHTLSEPVQVLFGHRIPPRSGWSTRVVGAEVPAVLSAAQCKALENAAGEALSLIVGPPGTGKSFTIAAVAIDALSRGESVLVASKTDTAVDVVADKLTAMLGDVDAVVRGGRRDYGRQLKKSLLSLAHDGVLAPSPLKVEALADQRRKLDAEIEALAAALAERSRREVRWGELDASLEADGGWRPTARFEHWWLRRSLDRTPEYWRSMATYRELLEARIGVQSEQLRASSGQRLHDLVRVRRRWLVRLANSIKARTVARRGEAWGTDGAKILLKALPIWLVRLADVSSVLPLTRGLFDLVVLDEATQCDLASSVPVLQRGRRAVVVGDPKQLRHLSFLARARQLRLAERHGLDHDDVEALDYREQSVLDRVDAVLESQDRVAHLDEHFRSVPAIISFSNREFYRRRLRVMQEHPAHDYRRALYLHRVDGRRLDDGANPVEAEALVAAVVERIAASRPHDVVPSIGVLSPFRAQVEVLGQLLDERLDGPQRARHALRVGTPYAFQGSERDIMFLSFALDGESHPAAFRYLNRADVFNVAVTRACNRQEVFVSIAADHPALARAELFRRFLEHMVEDGLSAAPRSIDDRFLVEVRHRLELESFRVWPAYQVAGMEIDLVVEHEGACLGIDLVGYPGLFAGSFDLERYRLHNRAGLRLFPLPWSAWRKDSAACVRAIRAAAREEKRQQRSAIIGP